MSIRAVQRTGIGAIVVAMMLGHWAPAWALVRMPRPESTSALWGTSAHGVFGVYQENREKGIPNLVTTDLFLAGYEGIAAAEQLRLEKHVALPLLEEVVKRLSKAVQEAPENQPATILNRNYLAVLSALLRRTHAHLSGNARREFEAVQQARGIEVSPLFGYDIDYSQLRPRGAYAGDPTLARYFVATRYASAVLFHVVASRATGVDGEKADRAFLAAKQLATLLTTRPDLKQAYARLSTLFDQLIGPADDLTAQELLDPSKRDARASPARQRAQLLAWAVAHDALPRILGEVVDAARLEPDRSVAEVTLGWRLLPARRTVVSVAFQYLVHSNAHDLTWLQPAPNAPIPFLAGRVGNGVFKVFPSLLEIGAALGSQSALETLTASGNRAFAGAHWNAAAAALASGSPLAEARLLLLYTLWAEQSSGPTSAQALWTLERHRELLYVKESYTVTGKGFRQPGSEPSARRGAAIDVNIPAMLALRRLVSLREKLEPSRRWTAFTTLIDRAINVQTELMLRSGRTTPREDAFLNGVDASLRALAGGYDEPVVVDIHVDPAAGRAMYEATGLPIVEVTPRGQRGALLSHAEFTGPMAPRLDDQEWQMALASGNLKPLRLTMAPWSPLAAVQHLSLPAQATERPLAN